MISHFVRKNLACFIPKQIFNCAQIQCFFSSSSSSPEEQPATSPTVFDFLLHNHNFSPEAAERIASIYPRLINPEKADSVLSFLKETGFSHTQLEKIIRHRPRFLSAKADDLGFSSADICSIISNDPAILHMSVGNNIKPSLSVLKDLLGSNYNVARILKLSAWFVTSNLETTMVPNFEFLKSVGIPRDRILLLLHNYPRTFLLKPETIRRSVDKAEEMGVDRSSKAPSSFVSSMVKIKKITEVILGTGKYTLSCIVKHPVCFSCSVEKRYKPRFRILGILESRNLIENWPSLGEVYILTDDKFFEKFVRPYSDVVGDDDAYVKTSLVRGKRGIKY
ncbi:hypothetical protein MIMGU_mgv1a009656mg [Erythranthe guttata]|uniref:Uncharacterized protein n=1 Tax=Erythranthe guttata TaxID=4155 RepID=A0A022Q3F9_ERYGU|nr:hypothetical protein MIMGU_mgv1a009656mg [Erythranthe guttata]